MNTFKQSAIEILKKAKKLLHIKFRDEKVCLGNMDHEMGYFLDNWNLIK